MNIDELFDKVEENPIRFFLTFWVVGGLLSLVGLVIVILIIAAILNGFGLI